MSYMRGNPYAWSDNEGGFHVWVSEEPGRGIETLRLPEEYGRSGGVRIPAEVFDALVLMRFAELAKNSDPLRMSRIIEVACDQAGNSGAAALLGDSGPTPDDVANLWLAVTDRVHGRAE